MKVIRTNTFKNYVTTLSRYVNYLEANEIFTQTYTDISSSTLGDIESGKMGKKATKKKSSSIRETPRGRIPTA